MGIHQNKNKQDPYYSGFVQYLIQLNDGRLAFSLKDNTIILKIISNDEYIDMITGHVALSIV